MRIFLYIILLSGVVLGACATDQKKSNKVDASEFAGSDSTKIMYYHCIMYRDTSVTDYGKVVYHRYQSDNDLLRAIGGIYDFYCYKLEDTVFTYFYVEDSPERYEDISKNVAKFHFVFINTPSTFKILSTPEALPQIPEKANDFGALMEYIKTQEKELPTARFIGHSIDPSQEFTGWQYEFDKKVDKEKQNVILSGSNGFVYRLRMPKGIKLRNLPPFLFADFRNFAEMCLPTLSDWDWNLYHEPD